MKPDVPVARRSDYLIAAIDHARGVRLISAHHYARGCSNTGIMHGLIRKSDSLIVGACCWLPPTRVCAESVTRHFKSPEKWRDVLALSRLVVVPGEPQNCATMLIAGSIRLLPERWRWLVTFADESQKHTGNIYRAQGWEFIGRTKPEPRWLDSSGRQVSKKSASNSRSAEQMTAMGLRLEGRFSKLKFVKARS